MRANAATAHRLCGRTVQADAMSVLADLAWRIVQPSARVIYERGRAKQRANLRAVISPDQFRKLADWFDTDDEFKEAMFPETWGPGSRPDEWQQDLRRFAALLEGDADGH